MKIALVTVTLLLIASAAVADVFNCDVSHWGSQESSADGLFTGLLGLSVCQSDGRLVAADGGNQRIQWFLQRTCPTNDPVGCFQFNQVVGNTPSGIACANDGNVYFGKIEGNLLKLDPGGNQLKVLLGLSYSPQLVAFDETYQEVWASGPTTGTIFCYDDTLGAKSGRIIVFSNEHPQGLFARGGYLYVTTDMENVYKIPLNNIPVTSAPLFNVNEGSDHSPWGIIPDACNNLAIAHKDSDKVNFYSEAGVRLYTLDLPANSSPRYLAADYAGLKLYVSEAGYRVERYDLACVCKTSVTPTTWSLLKGRRW